MAIVLDAEAGALSAELIRRGIAAHTRVHVLVELMDSPDFGDMAQEGGAFAWLDQEPELYTDADLLPPA